jgi:hypothetical protein
MNGYTMSGGLSLTPERLADLRAAGRLDVFRLPSGETRLYFSDSTYRTVNVRAGELLAAGLLRVGAQVYAPSAQRKGWRYVVLTRAGTKALADAGRDDDD